MHDNRTATLSLYPPPPHRPCAVLAAHLAMALSVPVHRHQRADEPLVALMQRECVAVACRCPSADWADVSSVGYLNAVAYVGCGRRTNAECDAWRWHRAIGRLPAECVAEVCVRCADATQLKGNRDEEVRFLVAKLARLRTLRLDEQQTYIRGDESSSWYTVVCHTIVSHTREDPTTPYAIQFNASAALSWLL